MSVNGTPTTIYDAMGKDTLLFTFHPGPLIQESSLDRLFVEQASHWFDSVWGTIAREQPA